jgi:predicted PurR-regulated permease PerM
MYNPVSLRIPRWIQLVSLPLAVLAAWTLAGALQSTLIVFLIASLVAVFLNPFVRSLIRLSLRRGLAVLIVYLAGFALVIGVITIAGTAAVNQIQGAAKAVENEFTVNPATHRTPADAKIDEFQRWLDHHGLTRIHVRTIGREAVARLSKQGVSVYVTRAVDIGRSVAPAIISGVFDAILILVISVYMLLSAPRLDRFVNRLFPPGPDGATLGAVVQHALASYVRGQLAVSLIIGSSAGIAMEIFGLVGIWPAARGYAIFFAVWAAVTEVIPYLGPILGALPAVALALFDHPLTALWVGLAYLAIHQLEGHVVVPRVMGSALKSHPLAVIFGLLAGAEMYGLLGALLALPLLSIGRAVYTFLRARVEFEPWPRYGLAGLGLGAGEPFSPLPPRPVAPPPPAAAHPSGRDQEPVLPGSDDGVSEASPPDEPVPVPGLDAPSDPASIVPRPPWTRPGRTPGQSERKEDER